MQRKYGADLNQERRGWLQPTQSLGAAFLAHRLDAQGHITPHCLASLYQLTHGVLLPSHRALNTRHDASIWQEGLVAEASQLALQHGAKAPRLVGNRPRFMPYSCPMQLLARHRCCTKTG